MKRSEYLKEWYRKHPEKEKEYARRYRANHREQLRTAYYNRLDKELVYRNRYRSSLRGFFVRMLGGARKRYAVTITLDDLFEIWNRQEGRCALTDYEMVTSGSQYEPMKASLDRIDSNGIYEKENVRLVCLWSNIARHVQTDGDFIDLCALVAENAESKLRVDIFSDGHTEFCF